MDKRTAEINDDTQGDFQAGKRGGAKSWSELATKVVVSKYFYGNKDQRAGDIGAATDPPGLPDDGGLGVRDGYFDLRAGFVL